MKMIHAALAAAMSLPLAGAAHAALIGPSGGTGLSGEYARASDRPFALSHRIIGTLQAGQRKTEHGVVEGVFIGMAPNLLLEDDAGGVERCARQHWLVASPVNHRFGQRQGGGVAAQCGGRELEQPGLLLIAQQQDDVLKRDDNVLGACG